MWLKAGAHRFLWTPRAQVAPAPPPHYGSPAYQGPPHGYVHPGPHGGPMPYGGVPAGPAPPAAPPAPVPVPPGTNLDGGPGCVLHVSVVDSYYPVSIDILYTIFQPYGPVIRIVLVNKKTVNYNEAPGNLQALVQFSNAALANSARMVPASSHDATVAVKVDEGLTTRGCGCDAERPCACRT